MNPPDDPRDPRDPLPPADETPPEPPRERRRHGRVRRWVVRPFIWGFLFLVTLVAVAWFFLESPYAHRRTAALVVARAEELLNRDIKVGRVEYSLVDLSFELHDVVVSGPTPEDPDFARVPVVRVDFSWRNLRQRILRLQQIDIVRPYVYLRFNPDGTSNLPQLRTRKGAKSRFQVQIGRVIVEDGVVEMDEMRLPLDLDARAVRALASGSNNPDGTIRLDAHVTAQDVVTTLPRATPYPFTASVKGSFVPGTVTFSAIRVAGPDLKATAEGGFQWRGKERRLGLEIAADGWAQLANRLGYVKEPLQGPFSFQGRLDRVGRDLTYGGTVRSPRLSALNREFDEIEAALVGGRDGMEIDVERALYAGGTVEGIISVAYRKEGGREGDQSEPGTPVELDLTFDSLDIRTLAFDQFGEDVPVVRDLAGRASGDLVYRFETGEPIAGSGLADVQFKAVQAQSGLPLSGTAPITIENGVLSSDAIRLTAPNQTVTGSDFVFDMDGGTGGFDFRLVSRDVGPLAPILRGDLPRGPKGEQPPPIWIPSEGSGTAEGSVDIADGRFTAALRLDLQDVVSPIVTADTVRGSFRYSPAAVDDLRLEAVADGGALMVTGRVPLEEEGRRRRAPEPLSLAIDAQEWPAQGIVAFLVPALAESGIEGRVSGRLDLGGTGDNLNGRAEVGIARLRVSGSDVGDVQAGVAFEGTQVRIERALAQTPAGSVFVAGTFDTESKVLDLTVDAPSLSLAADPLRQALGGEIEGRASLAAAIGGTLDRPQGTATLRGTGLTVSGRPLGETGSAEAMATWDGASLTASGSLLGLASFEGGGLLTMERADLRFQVRSDDLGTLVRIASPQPLPGLAGSFTGSVGFVSEFAGGTWNAELVLADLRARYEGHTLVNREPVLLEITPERLAVRSFYVGEPQTDNELFISGTVGFPGPAPVPAGSGDQGGLLDLRLQSTLAATWAEVFLPVGFEVEGYLDTLAVVRGTTSDPLLDGQGVIRDARVLVPEFPHALENIEGVILFNRDALVLDNLRAEMGGGTIRATGRVAIPGEGSDSVDYRLQVEAREVSVRWPEPFILRGDATLALVSEGKAGTRQIRGAVTLERAFFVQDVQTDAIPLLLQALQRERLEVVETDEFLATTQLNIQVDGPGALRVNNNVADLRGDIDLDVRGTLAVPVVFGEVEINPGGTLVYSDNEYEIERGRLTFTNPNRIDPIIDLVARTEVRSFDITLSLSGTLDRLDTRFASDEGLAELEVLALLFSGEQLDDPGLARPRAPGEVTPEQDVRAQSFLAGQAASLVSRRVNSLFGFDRFRIDPLASSETGGAVGGVRLTVGKRISRDLFVTYTTNPASSEEYLVRLEWQVARNVVLVFTRNGRDDTYAVDAEWEKRY